MPNSYSVLDLFCGCGGLSLGFEMAGFEVKLAIDNWEDALVTYRKNHKGSKTLNGDLLTLKPEDVDTKFGIHDISVIIGGPPCQGFSVAGKRIIDKAFDRGLISFLNNGVVIFSQKLKENVGKDYYTRYFMPVEGTKLIVPRKYHPSKEFLEWHRDSISQK